MDNLLSFNALTEERRGVKCAQKGEYLVTDVCRFQRDQGTRFDRSGARALQRSVAARESTINAWQLSVADAQFGKEQREFYNPNQQKDLDVSIEFVCGRTKWEEGRQHSRFRRADGKLFRTRCGGKIARLVFGSERKVATREAN